MGFNSAFKGLIIYWHLQAAVLIFVFMKETKYKKVHLKALLTGLSLRETFFKIHTSFTPVIASK
jgi:hypothetical protein